MNQRRGGQNSLANPVIAELQALPVACGHARKGYGFIRTPAIRKVCKICYLRWHGRPVYVAPRQRRSAP